MATLVKLGEPALGEPGAAGLGGGAGGGPLNRILVPVDAGGRAGEAIALAAAMSCAAGGVVRLVHVREDEARAELDGSLAEARAEAEALVDQALLGAWSRGCNASGQVVAAPRAYLAAAILSAASAWDAGVIVMARRRRRAVARLLAGSVVDTVMRWATCPVLVVRAGSR